jgi:hypothetical protein
MAGRASGWRRAGCVALVALGAVAVPQAAAGSQGAAHAAAATKIPDVRGPIPTTRTSRPFLGENVDLAARGYSLQEYFVSGKANVYDWGADGNAATPQVRTANAPYTTRFVVRRPKNAKRFSGNVWVELNNPSRAYDAETTWISAHDKFMRDGDIHVAITVKPIAMAALKRFDAKRYSRLSMANPLPADKQACGLLPRQAGYDENLSKLYENGLAWDIVSQVGALVRSKDRENPLRRFRVKHMFATGESQTASYVDTYAYGFANAAKLRSGKPIYNGFVSVSFSGAPRAINQCIPLIGLGDKRAALPARHVPHMHINSQTEPITLSSYAWRKPDSDKRSAGYRLYEIAGATHGWSLLGSIDAPWSDLEKVGGVQLRYTCAEGKWNSLPRQWIHPAMFRNMERWVAKGTLPPKMAEPIHVINGGTPQATFETDRFGNVLGGVRTPYVDVPVAKYSGTATSDGGPTGSFCRLLGYEQPFTSTTLQNLYGTHQNYVARVSRQVRRMVRQRWLEPVDARQIVKRAQYTTVP